MVNWKKLAKQIPSQVQIGNKLFYEVVWVKEFETPKTVGEMDIEKKQLRLKIDQSDKEKVLTYLHELTHAFSDENNVGLTEKQVSTLEKKMFYYLLKKQNVFTKE